ncbi:MAG: hypothetical protein ACP6IY_22760 [Promethearchaeia archaeon]
MISLIGLLDGITASSIVLSSTIFGLLSFYRASKLGAKLLAIAGLTMFFVGFLWLGPMVDFFMVLFTETNLNPEMIYSVLSYMWVAPALITSMYLGSELMIPKRKWIIVGIYIVLGLIFEYFLWFHNSESFYYKPLVPGDLIDAEFRREFFTFILVAFFLLSALIFLGIGFLLKAKQATGDLRKKFIYLALGFIIFVVCGALDSIIEPGIAIGFIRVIMMTFALWMYLGLKT